MSNSLNRRAFVAGATGLSAALVGGLHGSESLAQTPVERLGESKLKMGLNAYSFAPLLDANPVAPDQRMGLHDVLEFCASENLDGVDPTGYFFPGYPKVPTDQYLNTFKKRAFQLGLDICGTGIRNNFASHDKSARAADVQLIKNWVEVAARLGAPVLRVFAGAMPQGFAWDEVAKWMADELRICAEYGEKYGVIIGVQNHGDSLKTGDDVVKLLKLVDHEWLGVVIDTGWFMSADPYEDIAKVAPFAANWQIKEFVDGSKRKSPTDVKRLIKIIRQAGFRGYIPIETLSTKGVPYDPKARARELLAEIRKELAL